MFETMLCSLFTIVPDYLFRRYRQGKRFGRDITLFTVWYELRWGITGCLILTVLLITTIFYSHPSSQSAMSYFRTVPILPEISGRVDEIYVGLRDRVKMGQPLFKLDSVQQEAALNTAKRKVEEIAASLEQLNAELDAAQGVVDQALGAYNQAKDELDTKVKLNRRSPQTVARREIESLHRSVETRQGALAAAKANHQAVYAQLTSVLPAQMASAQAQRKQAQVELEKTTVYAGVDGQMEQFNLRKGDIVNPLLRPAGVLIPTEAGHRALVAGFGQIEAQVIKVGMVAEATCAARPLTIIPLVATQIQGVIAAGQIRATDVLVDPLQAVRPGSLTVFLEPLYSDGLNGLPPGSSCIVNAYTNNRERLSQEGLGFWEHLSLHVIDTIGLVHALILRMQALVLPVQTLVLSGH